MPKKLTFEHVYDYIKSKGCELISKEYNNNCEMLDMRCGICNEIYQQSLVRFKSGYHHPFCNNTEKLPFGGYKTPRTLKKINCLICNKEFLPRYSKKKLCSKECSTAQWRTEEYRLHAKENGKKGGQISATKQSRRSKNEIYFSELCSNYFEITTNEPFFEGWDADVIIHSEKVAILWNGQWHYKQISKTQSLKQVQARDKVKISIIEKMGYTPYVIKDMGKYNTKFVEQEFEIFLFMRIQIE